jgi:hypothetical protein
MDPHEERNLAAEPEHRELAARLRAELGRLVLQSLSL